MKCRLPERNLYFGRLVYFDMKVSTFICITSALVAFGAPALRADTTTNEPPAIHKHGKGGNGKEFMKTIGLAPADLKGLSPEDRRSKIQSAAEAAEGNLKAKEAAGTITDQEKTDLALIEKRLSHEKKK
jgi:hypothetical protein